MPIWLRKWIENVGIYRVVEAIQIGIERAYFLDRSCMLLISIHEISFGRKHILASIVSYLGYVFLEQELGIHFL